MSEHINNQEHISIEAKITSDNCNLIINNGSKKDARYNLDYFSNIFSPEEILKDEKTIEFIKKGFELKRDQLSVSDRENLYHSHKRSEALEVIIGDQIELSDWFGENSLFFRTTEYDDFVNKVDAVVEFDIGDNPEKLALSIDSTSRTETSKIESKVKTNIAKLLNNSLEVKYFESQINDFKGSLKNIIPVVIGLGAINTNELINNFGNLLRQSQKRDDQSLPSNERVSARQRIPQIQRDIANDPVQIIFLKEIKSQLEMYKSILIRENNPNILVKEANVDSLYKIIEDVLNEKKSIEQSPKMPILEKDDVFNLISYVSKKNIVKN